MDGPRTEHLPAQWRERKAKVDSFKAHNRPDLIPRYTVREDDAAELVDLVGRGDRGLALFGLVGLCRGLWRRAGFLEPGGT